MTKFKILDWAGNECISHESFPTFEDAWGAIYEYFDKLEDAEFDAELGEYQVLEVPNRCVRGN